MEAGDVGLAAAQVVVGEAAAEAFVELGLEAEADGAGGGADVLGAAGEEGVELPAVGGGDVLDVADVLEAAFYLEGGDAGVEQFFEGVDEVEVFEGEEVFVAGDGLAVGIDEAEGEAAELGALAAVGAAAEAGLAGVALSAVADAEGAVDEDFEGDVGAGVVDGADVVQAEFAGEDDLPEAGAGQEADFLGGAVVHLGAGVQGDGRQVQAGDAKVLHDEGVDADAIEGVDELLGFGEFGIAQQGVEGDVDAHVVEVGVADEAGDVVEAVGGGGAGSVLGGADVDGVGSVAHGFEAALQIAGGGEEFYLALLYHCCGPPATGFR